MNRLLKIVSVLFILGALLVGVFLLTMLSALRPEPVAPIVSTLDVTAPKRVRAQPLTADSGCTIQVQIVDADEDPVAGAAVTIRGERSGEGAVYATGTHGWTEPVGWPCGIVYVSAADGIERTPTLGLLLVEPGPQEVTLTLAGTVRIFGSITDEEGAPIEQATLINGGSTSVATGGRYEIWVPVEDPFTTVTARGYHTEYISPQGLSVEASPELEHDLILLSDERVAVFCAGLPGDRCSGMLVNCSTPLLPLGGECSVEEGLMLCVCPSGEAAVRGGGRATLIGADDTEAWLDFRDTGSLSGRIVDSGQPVTPCSLILVRLPMGLEDIPRGVIVGQRASCAHDGSFVFHGLVSGDWELMLKASPGGRDRMLQPVPLRAQEHKDIGDVEVWEGGGIEGILIDGLTGEPTSGPILALRQASGDERTMPAPTQAARSSGAFSLGGIPAGTWRVFTPMSPHQSVTVVVEDGAITDGVEVITSEATALQANGFSLTSEDDLLIIEAVAPGSPADDAGLRPGDAIVGIMVAGVELSGMGGVSMPSLARLLLGNYDGPGITVLVEQDGEPLEVSLEW